MAQHNFDYIQRAFFHVGKGSVYGYTMVRTSHIRYKRNARLRV